MTKLAAVFQSHHSGYWGVDAGAADFDVRAIRNGDVGTSGELRWDSLPLRGFSERECERALVRAGDIVLTTSGNCGNVAFIADDPAEPTAATNFVRILRTDSEAVDPRYAFHFLRTRTFRDALGPFIRGATIQNLSVAAAFDVVQIPTPALVEQRRIAGILDQADALRAKRRQAVAYLDDLTRSIFMDMFGDPLSNRRELARAAIGDVSTVVTGNSPSRADATNFGSEIEWIKSDNLGRWTAATAEEGLSAKGREKARIAPAGSVLVTCIAGSPKSIGKASIVDREVAFNQQINAVLPSPELEPTFLLAQLKTAPGLVRGKSTGGMKGLVSKSAFESIEILVPPVERQRQFVERNGRVMRQEARLESARIAGEALFESLQSRAFLGEL